MRTVWLATRNSDLTEGRGPMMTIAAFADQDAAKRVTRGWGVMGVGDGVVEPLIVYDSFSEYDKEKKEEAKNKALAKLTHEDRIALGLIR